MIQTKLGRNDPCLCGSGKKYKSCCLTGPKKPASITQMEATQAARMAWSNYQAGRTAQAELLARQIIQAFPNHTDAWHLLGVIALQDGNIELAIADFRKATSNNNKNPILYSNLGLALHEKGCLAEAEANYRKAIALNPLYADAHYNLHALLLGNADITQSINCLEKILMVNPQDLDARLNLGILLDRKDAAEAAEHLEAIPPNASLLKARLDAWNYIKSNGGKFLPMLGSNISTFEHAFGVAKLGGLVMEFGVRHGNTLRQIAKLAGQEVHGFDSFEGLPEEWHHEPKGSYTTKGVIPTMPGNVKLHAGWFEDTLPAFLERNDQKARLINIDCDIYSSTKTVLELLAPRIVSGTIIIFDEYIGNEHWREDEFKAFQQAVAMYQWRYEYLSFSMFTKQVTVRIL